MNVNCKSTKVFIGFIHEIRFLFLILACRIDRDRQETIIGMHSIPYSCYAGLGIM